MLSLLQERPHFSKRPVNARFYSRFRLPEYPGDVFVGVTLKEVQDDAGAIPFPERIERGIEVERVSGARAVSSGGSDSGGSASSRKVTREFCRSRSSAQLMTMRVIQEEKYSGVLSALRLRSAL